MQGKTLKEWIKIYEEKTGDRAELPKDYRLFYLAERGFAIMKPDTEGKIMTVYQTCGDGKFWRDMAELYACALGLECVATICTRPIKAYIRAFGWEILKEKCVDGRYRFCCQDGIGRKIIITHRNDGEDGKLPEYWVTQYLNEKATADTENNFTVKEVSKCTN